MVDRDDGLAYAIDARLAPHYERHMVDECGYRTPEVVAEIVASLTKMDSGVQRWLDLGAGTGLVGKALARLGVPLELVALDVSPAMLDLIDCPLYVARRVADVRADMPLDCGPFDGVVAAGLLEHFADPLPVLFCGARAKRSGRPLVLSFPPNRSGRSEPCAHEPMLWSHDVEAMGTALECIGLSVEREMEIPAYVSGSHGWIAHRIVVAV